MCEYNRQKPCSWLGICGNLFLGLFLLSWVVTSLVILGEELKKYDWNNTANDVNGTIKEYYYASSTYYGNCDPRCIQGCGYCNFPCYSGSILRIYMVNIITYNIYDRIAHCWVSNSSVQITLSKYPIGSFFFMIWYNKKDPKDFAYALKPTKFITWAIAFPIVFVVFVGLIVGTSLLAFKRGNKCLCY